MSIVKMASSQLIQEIIKLGSSKISGELTEEVISKMLKDIDISSALELMNESIVSRDWIITTDNNEYANLALEIQKRFNNINMSKILKDMLKATIYKKAIFEISYKDMVINDLVLIPNKFIKYDKDKGWKIKTKNEEIIIDNEKNRFLLCINNESLENLEGESELEPLVRTFNAKENLEIKLNTIIEKYGDIITVFAYEPPLETASTEEKEARWKSVEEQAKQLKNAKGKDILAVPTAGEKSLKDFVEFIKLDDLKPEIYVQLQEEKVKAIQKYILGSTLVTGVDGNSGNRALGEVHDRQKDLKINAKIKKIRDWFQKIIEIDAEIYGYDSKNFYFKFVEEIDEEETLLLDKQRTEILNQKMDMLNKLLAIGYTLTKNKIAEILGISIEDLKEIENTLTEGKTLTTEFSKKEENELEKRKKIEKNIIEFDKFIDKTFDRFHNNIIEAIKNSLKNIESIEDFDDIKYNYDNILEEMLVKSELLGYDNASTIDQHLEFSNADNMIRSKNSALDYFLHKYPALYDDVEATLEYSRHKYFYVKKITDIQITEKLLKDLIKNVENGETFEDWKKNISNILDSSGITLKEGYLKTVYRTNMNQAYNAGIYKKQLKYKEDWPYFKYCGIIDGREQEHTKKLHGKIFKVGSPEAIKYYPPNGYNCRCYTISLTEKEVEGQEKNIVKGDIDGLKLGIFNGNVGDQEYIKELENKYQIKAKEFNNAKNKRRLIENSWLEKDKIYKNAIDIDNLYDIIDVGDITYEEHKAIEIYSGKEYKNINEALISDEITEDLEKIISDISSAINKNKLKENIIVFRGIDKEYAKELNNYEDNIIGENFTQKSFLSTSLSYHVTKKDFAKSKDSIIFILKVKKGTNVIFLSNQDSKYPNQLELLFDKGKNIVIEKKYIKNNQIIMEGVIE